MALLKSILALNNIDIEQLVTDQERETKTIEYKAVLPGNSDEEKKEFLADVSSFANTVGGHILFGIPGIDGIPQPPIGIPLHNADAEQSRLENILRTSLAPRVSHIEMRVIEGFTNGAVLAIGVPQSWSAPHMVTYKGSSRFYARNSNGKYQMDVHELRTAFAKSELVSERIREFRDKRLIALQSGEYPTYIATQGKDGAGLASTVLHVVPLEAFSRVTSFDIKSAERTEVLEKVAPLLNYPRTTALASYLAPYIQNHQWRYNVDGLVTYTGVAHSVGGPYHSYCQLYRTGVIESFDAYFLNVRGEHVFGDFLHAPILAAVNDYLAALKLLNLTPPFVVMLSFLGVRGYQIERKMGTLIGLNDGFIDRDVLTLPEALIDSYETDLPSALKPIFDVLANALGMQEWNMGAGMS